MKTTKRNNIWETNSSSMHAMTLPLERGETGVNLDKVKWKFDLDRYDASDFDAYGGPTLDNPKDIIYYCYVAILQHQEWGKEWAYDAEEALKSYLPNCIFVRPDEMEDEYGCVKWSINHQSNDAEFVKMMINDKELFKDVVLNGSIHLWCDGEWGRDVSNFSRVVLSDGRDVKEKWEKYGEDAEDEDNV